jgi:hypothetical protein
MLFDLRSRGRRRTVQGVYLGLAVLMGGGLVLFGVGNGNGIGGILNAFNGSGNGNAQTAFASKQEKAALRQTQLHPSDPTTWAALVRARYQDGQQGLNTTTGTYSAGGQKALTGATQAWQRYLKLVKKPDSDLAVLAARAYDATGNFSSEASTWELVTAANPKVPTFYENLALAAWRAHETNIGDLASAKAVSLVPKASRFELKHQMTQLRQQAGIPATTTSTPATTTTTPATTTTTPAATTSTGKSGKSAKK